MSRPLKRFRVLVISEAANPDWASVPLIGWSLSQALGTVVDAHLVTQVRNREAILRAGLREGVDFTAIDNEWLASPLHKLSELLRGGAGKGWTTRSAFSALAYYSFEREVWRVFKQRLASGEFDFVHRITPLSPTSPSILASKLARLRVPFLLGPLNGGVPWPPGFQDRQHAEREWLSYVRSVYKLLPGYKSTLRDAAAIIVGSKFTLSEIPDWAKQKCVYIPENGIEPSRFSATRSRAQSYPLRCAFVGRLVPYKGADLLLEAASEFLKAGKLELLIVGDGPQKSSLQDMVNELGIGNAVQFCGWIPHAEVQQSLKDCDLLVLPSIREFGGGVVLEAMALGVPPIVADYAGPSELVDDRTGIRIPFSDRQSLVDGLKESLAKVISSPELLKSLGISAREKVFAKLTWEKKAHQIFEIYKAIKAGKTDFGYLGFKS